jgi:hypothetical protein
MAYSHGSSHEFREARTTMLKNVYKATAMIVMASAYLALSGCAETDVLQTSTGATTMTIELTAAAGATQWDEATFLGISQIMIRPVDPVADEALGPQDIGVLLGATDSMDLITGDRETVPSVVLSPGEYRVTRILLIPDSNILRLVDYDVPPPPTDNDCNGFPDTPDFQDPRDCLDQAMYPFQSREGEGEFVNGEWVCPAKDPDPPENPVLPTPGNVGGSPSRSEVYAVDYDDPDTAPRFSIGDGANTDVRLLVDSVGLIEDFEISFDCQDTSGCQAGVVLIPPPCIQEFYEREGTSDAGVQFDGFIPLFQDKFEF